MAIAEYDVVAYSTHQGTVYANTTHLLLAGLLVLGGWEGTWFV